MSGICGIIYFEKQPQPHDLPHMVLAMKHRARDGVFEKTTQHAAVAYLKLNVSDLSKIETGPLESTEGILIVADARLDNRDTLLKTFFEGELQQLRNSISNTALILAAYEFWGEDLLFHLMGDFAFVIWDKSRQKIICGRDHVAARPLYYYYLEGEYFAFASESKALLTLPNVQIRPSFEKIHEYVSWKAHRQPYQPTSFYEGIRAVQPAHVLRAEAGKCDSRQCWDLDLKRFENLRSDQEYFDVFRATFFEAVRCRIDSYGLLAAHLSGGVDSSSICAVVNLVFGQSLLTQYFDIGGNADEKEFVNEMLAHHDYHHQNILPILDWSESSRNLSNILGHPHYFLVLPNYIVTSSEALAACQCTLLLTGHDGDSVVGYGHGYPLSLLETHQKKEFMELMHDYALVADFGAQIKEWNAWSFRQKYRFIVKIYFKQHIKKKWYKKHYGQAILEILRWSFTLKFVPLDVNARILKKKNSFSPNSTPKEINTSYGFSEVENQLVGEILHEAMLQSIEEFEQIGAWYGYEVAHPFYDKRLIELCLAIPNRLKFDSGYRRGPLRHAMEDFLPEKVRLRTSKVTMNESVENQLNAVRTDMVELLIKAQKRLPSFFDEAQSQTLTPYFEKAIQVFSNPAYKGLARFVREVNLAQWLWSI